MDPNAALRRLREASKALAEAADGDSNDTEIEAAHELREAVDDLDQWLSNGGFLPLYWSRSNDLSVSFAPEAIREHFEAGEDDPTEGVPDTVLREVGLWALADDSLWRLFHELLVDGLKAMTKEDSSGS